MRETHMIKGILVDVERRKIRQVTLSGGYIYGGLDELLDLGHREYDYANHILNGHNVLLIYAEGSKDSSDPKHWRIKSDEPYAQTYFGSGVFLASENTSAEYSNFIDRDCPLTCDEVAVLIEWGTHSEDFSELSAVAASSEDIEKT